jgi:glyoxylase-like metal-dependent hydrolase (beta-lactamase superfamily II)
MPQTTTYTPSLQGNPMSATGSQYPNGNPDAPMNPRAAENTDSCLPLHPTKEVAHDYACDVPAPGNIAFRWIYGSNIAALNHDPRIQAMQYNEDTYILRQNVCVHWEAPFTYLLFGNRGALLIDTGATPEPAFYPLRATVDAMIKRWCQIRNKQDVPLTIVLTSAEDLAQNQGLHQFTGRPNTTLMPKSPGTTIDLGGRILTVLATPGTHKDGITFYDSYTRFLFTGDLLYPGKINISNDRDFVISLQRLQAWAQAHPVKWVMGGHIEMQFVPGKAYPRFATYKPYERLLQMEPAVIAEAVEFAQQVQGKQLMLIRPDFILLNGVSPDQRTTVFPAGVPSINAPRPF